MNQPTANTLSINNLPASKQVSALSESLLPGNPPKPTRRAPKPLPKRAPQDRCRHFTATGRRCRLAILDPASGLCFRHVGLQFLASGDEDLSPAFLGLLSGFQSASRIHDFLTQVTVLLVQSRISTRRAAILAYLAQILLRTLPAIDQQEKAASASEPSDQLFPQHLQELIDAKRRFAHESSVRNTADAVNSQSPRTEEKTG